jgi:hypothetical protein
LQQTSLAWKSKSRSALLETAAGESPDYDH